MTTPTPNDPGYTPVRSYQPVRYSDPDNWYQRAFNRVPAGARDVDVPNGIPRFLGNRSVIFHAWLISMIIVGFDEWRNLNILPRPARLWDTSLFYGLLTLFSAADPLVPIANAFAIGYTFTLLWQYYNGGITPSTDAGASKGTTSASNTTGNLSPAAGITGVTVPIPTPPGTGG